MSRYIDYMLNSGYVAEENIEHAITILRLILDNGASERNSDNADVAVAFERTTYCLNALKGIHEKLSDVLWDCQTLKSREPQPHDRYFLFEDGEPIEVSFDRYAEAKGELAPDEEPPADQDTFPV